MLTIDELRTLLQEDENNSPDIEAVRRVVPVPKADIRRRTWPLLASAASAAAVAISASMIIGAHWGAANGPAQVVSVAPTSPHVNPTTAAERAAVGEAVDALNRVRTQQVLAAAQLECARSAEEQGLFGPATMEESVPIRTFARECAAELGATEPTGLRWTLTSSDELAAQWPEFRPAGHRSVLVIEVSGTLLRLDESELPVVALVVLDRDAAAVHIGLVDQGASDDQFDIAMLGTVHTLN